MGRRARSSGVGQVAGSCLARVPASAAVSPTASLDSQGAAKRSRSIALSNNHETSDRRTTPKAPRSFVAGVSRTVAYRRQGLGTANDTCPKGGARDSHRTRSQMEAAMSALGPAAGSWEAGSSPARPRHRCPTRGGPPRRRRRIRAPSRGVAPDPPRPRRGPPRCWPASRVGRRPAEPRGWSSGAQPPAPPSRSNPAARRPRLPSRRRPHPVRMPARVRAGDGEEARPDAERGQRHQEDPPPRRSSLIMGRVRIASEGPIQTRLLAGDWPDAPLRYGTEKPR